MRPVTKPARPARASLREKVQRSKVRRKTQCGKQGYTSRKIASAKAGASRQMSGELILPYHCYRCHCWHIGHPPGSRPMEGTTHV